MSQKISSAGSVALLRHEPKLQLYRRFGVLLLPKLDQQIRTPVAQNKGTVYAGVAGRAKSDQSAGSVYPRAAMVNHQALHFTTCTATPMVAL